MKKLLQSLFILLCIAGSAMAQDRTVTGRVVSNEDNLPIPGVTVKVPNTRIGAVTNANGLYSIKVPSSANSLSFAFIGYITQRKAIPQNNQVNATLLLDAQTLTEVTVTSALGVTRTERSLGTAQQSIKGSDLTDTKQTDLNTALAGKIAGVQVLGGSGARFGTASIRIRGINSISGGRDPLYVVDGVVVPSTSINLDDVADLTVLKGPAATSLYGQRGDAGVVVIKSKTGAGKGLGIEINHTTTFENVSTLPKYQNEYGGGPSQEWNYFKFNPATDAPALAAMDGARYYNYAVDESWAQNLMDSLMLHGTLGINSILSMHKRNLMLHNRTISEIFTTLVFKTTLT